MRPSRPVNGDARCLAKTRGRAPVTGNVRKLMDSANNEPKGIRGWLILPALGLIFTPIRMGVQFSKDLMPALTPATWNALTRPESPAYHPLWGPLISFE